MILRIIELGEINRRQVADAPAWKSLFTAVVSNNSAGNQRVRYRLGDIIDRYKLPSLNSNDSGHELL
ncbi:hypothetical protein D3C80_1950830 [compost metagenome]